LKTPEGKQIYYTYDGYGRQKRKETPDNGQVNMKYNNDNSLRFSQDNSQLHHDQGRPSRYYTFHGYDGQNRMVYSGEIHDLTGAQGFDNLNPMQHYSFENYNEHPDNFLYFTAQKRLCENYKKHLKFVNIFKITIFNILF